MEDLCTCGCSVSVHTVDEDPELSGICAVCLECPGFCPADDLPGEFEYLPWDYEDDNSYDTPFEEHLDA